MNRILDQKRAWAERWNLPGPGEPKWYGLDYRDVENMLVGEDVLIVGMGPSFMTTPHIRYTARDGARTTYLDSYWTISCNRACSIFNPTFAACFEPYMDKDCWDTIHKANPLFVITDDFAETHRRSIRFPERLPAALHGWPEIGCSGYYAATAAAWMGARNIGLLGAADFIGHPKLGTEKSIWILREAFALLQEMLQARGGGLFKIGEPPDKQVQERLAREMRSGKSTIAMLQAIRKNALAGIVPVVGLDVIKPRIGGP